jgi:uncharacterized membrane protein YcjF (UPF0283 family)
VQGHYLSLVVAVAAVLLVALVVHRLVVQEHRALVQVQQQQRTQVQAVAVLVQVPTQAAQAVAELSTSGLRYKHGTFCTNK